MIVTSLRKTYVHFLGTSKRGGINLTHPVAVVGIARAWIRVFTKSNGWNKIVEQVPLKAPARNAFGRDVWGKKTRMIS